MRNEVQKAIASVDRSSWKKVDLPFGEERLHLEVPASCRVLTMRDRPPLGDPEAVIRQALARPIQNPGLAAVVRNKDKPPEETTVSIAVSDITRPVPYKGKKGILFPILELLESTGILKDNIRMIVATGMHRPSNAEEKAEMFGEDVLAHYRVTDHNCDDAGSLLPLGPTRSGTEVYVNSTFFQADVRIVTGLVESHFMAGASGGRKAICPGLVDKRTIEKFHGPDFLESSLATNLVLEGNPCHEEASQVARMVGVDFSVNVTLDKEMRLTGVFAGDIEAAFASAVKDIRQFVVVPTEGDFDIVVTHGGYVGRNHYQTAKAAVGALPAVRDGGTLLVVADNRDPEPIGGTEYRTLIHLLKLQGPEGYVGMLKTPSWTFTKDQWEPEVWAKVIRKVGPDGLVYCTPSIQKQDYEILPGLRGWDFVDEDAEGSNRHIAQAMVQNTLIYRFYKLKKKGIQPSIALIGEGPYAVPTRVSAGFPSKKAAGVPG